MVPQPDPTLQYYHLGDFELQSGEILPSAFVAYRTYGSPTNPCVVYPTWFSGKIIAGNEWLISTPEHPHRRALDPAKYFIVVPALFGNGESTSPSNTSGPKGGANLPKTTYYDNVRAQHTLLTVGLGITDQIAVVGWSMGAAQTFQWASQYPDMVKLAVPFCGAARTSLHNWVFLEGLKATLRADKAGSQGQYLKETQEQPQVGLRAFGRVYASWGFSQTFYREKVYELQMGIRGLEEFMVQFWESWALSLDTDNVLHMMWTWQNGDIAAQPLYAGESRLESERMTDRGLGKPGAGDKEDELAFERALNGIQAKVLIMPGRTDLYFPPEDSQIEKDYLGEKAELKVIESIWGHFAGGPFDSEVDAQFIDDAIYTFFKQNGF
ncbi:hypothetical protein CPC16_010195 [Podila verticillata]|nr:hypothetical protein BGZ52_001498 [Haplosporangium bisporale]KAF9210406.1 hypothetical protein BGZ59_009474 [Podila verticillata]KAF9380697.1 hypothetical protein CPC16_010195 [Podila verticillata]KAI9239651.1 MAG: Alpha/Beta hydrolase protein [Podila humilis]KFH67233.1 homoserine O-acetyltransferase [Podila verticillata NRRL 6337]